MTHQTASASVSHVGAASQQKNEECVQSDESPNPWIDFKPPKQIPLSHPWISRYSSSAILTTQTTGSDRISTTDKKVYGNNIHPIAFRIGNGGAGYTKLLKVLSFNFILSHGRDFRIAWVANHSRHTQVALLADIVQVALTYEPDFEEVAEREGWCKRVCVPGFWDHFILVGPSANPAGISVGCAASVALREIAERCGVFYSRGDGSATFEKERKLWESAGVDVASSSNSWLETHAEPPYSALQRAGRDGAYLLTDRATFLTAKRDGVIPDLVVYVEGGEALLNPCSVLVNTMVPDSSGQRLANRFAEWLAEESAQSVFRGYGRVWELGMPLFTEAGRREFREGELLAGRNLEKNMDY